MSLKIQHFELNFIWQQQIPIKQKNSRAANIAFKKFIKQNTGLFVRGKEIGDNEKKIFLLNFQLFHQQIFLLKKLAGRSQMIKNKFSQKISFIRNLIYYFHIHYQSFLRGMQEQNEKRVQCQSVHSNQEDNLNPRSSLEQQQQETLQAIQLHKYHERMANFNCQNVEILKKKLQTQGILERKMFCSSIEKVIVKKLGNASLLKVSLGHYATQISILKIDFNPAYFQRYVFSAGVYGQIYKQKHQSNIIAIKSIKVKGGVNFEEELDRVLKEYFALKIASTLGYGPKLYRAFQYDIICFPNAIEYSMEFCEVLKNEKSKQIELDLFTGLKIMHSLQIVHQDIKIENISWSSAFQKWVFLDFGFTSFINQNPGQKTFTRFIGSYNYSSKQMKQLFHLKKPGFVDLYENDVYGLEHLIKKSPKLDSAFLAFQNSSLLEYFILLSKMEYKIWLQQLSEIQYLFEEHIELKNEFLRLILKGIESKTLIPSYQHELFLIFQKFKKTQFVNDNIGQETQQQHCFKCFINEDQNLIFDFLFMKPSDLNQLIKNSFMKKLFYFYNEVLHSNKEGYWKRMKLITDIISNQFVMSSQGKSWFAKFHQILQIFTSFFKQNKIYQPLQQISYFHLYFNDLTRQGNLLETTIQIETSQKQKDFYIQKFFRNLIYSPVESYKHFLSLKSFQEVQNQQLYLTIFKIAELIFNSTQKKQKYEQSLNLIQLQLNKLAIIEFMNEQLKNLIFMSVQRWRKKYFLPLQQKNAFKDELNTVLKYSERKQLMLGLAISKLNKLIQAPSNQSEQYFQLYPLCQQMPLICNFIYHLNQQNELKITEIAQDMFQLHRENLEDISNQLIYLSQRWNTKEKKREQFVYFFMTFLYQFKKSLSLNRIQKYWKIYSVLTFTLIDFEYQFEQKVKNQIISSIEFMINTFKKENLISTQKIYLLLLASLKQFIKGQPQFAHKLEVIENNALFGELKDITSVWIRSLECFTSYERIYRNCPILCQTKLYSQTLSNSQQLNHVFYEVPIFFEYVCRRFIVQHQEQKVIQTVLSLTTFLTKDQKNLNYFCYTIQGIFKQCTIQQLCFLSRFTLQFTIKSVRQNNFLSGFIFTSFFSMQPHLQKLFSKSEIKRAFTLSIISIHKYPYFQRVYIQRMLSYKFRFLEKKLKPRKKLILDRKDDYSAGKLSLVKKKTVQKMERIPKSHKIISKFFEKKIRKLQQNVEKQMTYMERKNMDSIRKKVQ